VLEEALEEMEREVLALVEKVLEEALEELEREVMAWLGNRLGLG
jgi:hypothetical protein